MSEGEELARALSPAAEQMAERGVGAAVVLDYGRLIGILSERDVLRAVAGRVHSSEARVRDWMTADPVTVPPETPIRQLARAMVDAHIHRVIVTDARGRPVGVVSSTDVLAAVAGTEAGG